MNHQKDGANANPEREQATMAQCRELLTSLSSSHSWCQDPIYNMNQTASLAPEESGSSVAAVFEFDGIIFHPEARWKIRDIRLGVLGSRVNFPEALHMYQSHVEQYPEMLLTDCFTLDEFEYPFIESSDENITPPEVIARTASNHLFRGHDLFFLSFSQHRELQSITDRLIGELRFPVLKNPFSEASHLYPRTGSFEQRAQDKFELVRRLLQRRDTRVMNRISSTQANYERIHLYHSDPLCAALLQRYVQDHKQELIGGRNAIVFSRIARAAEKNL
ncbi:MAG: hypothetical protein KDK39_03135 [Leptospiraceae bacterium]|nr:hypothetical protein [Leptospiraceae bacterium]